MNIYLPKLHTPSGSVYDIDLYGACAIRETDNDIHKRTVSLFVKMLDAKGIKINKTILDVFFPNGKVNLLWDHLPFLIPQDSILSAMSKTPFDVILENEMKAPFYISETCLHHYLLDLKVDYGHDLILGISKLANHSQYAECLKKSYPLKEGYELLNHLHHHLHQYTLKLNSHATVSVINVGLKNTSFDAAKEFVRNYDSDISSRLAFFQEIHDNPLFIKIKSFTLTKGYNDSQHNQ